MPESIWVPIRTCWRSIASTKLKPESAGHMGTSYERSYGNNCLQTPIAGGSPLKWRWREIICPFTSTTLAAILKRRLGQHQPDLLSLYSRGRFSMTLTNRQGRERPYPWPTYRSASFSTRAAIFGLARPAVCSHSTLQRRARAAG